MVSLRYPETMQGMMAIFLANMAAVKIRELSGGFRKTIEVWLDDVPATCDDTGLRHKNGPLKFH